MRTFSSFVKVELLAEINSLGADLLANLLNAQMKLSAVKSGTIYKCIACETAQVNRHLHSQLLELKHTTLQCSELQIL